MGTWKGLKKIVDISERKSIQGRKSVTAPKRSALSAATLPPRSHGA